MVALQPHKELFWKHLRFRDNPGGKGAPTCGSSTPPVSSQTLSTKRLLQRLLGTSAVSWSCGRRKDTTGHKQKLCTSYGTCNRPRAKAGCPHPRAAGKYPGQLFCPHAAIESQPGATHHVLDLDQPRDYSGRALMAVTPPQGGHHSTVRHQSGRTAALLAAKPLRHRPVPVKLRQAMQTWANPGTSARARQRRLRRANCLGTAHLRPPGELTGRLKLHPRRAPRGAFAKRQAPRKAAPPGGKLRAQTLAQPSKRTDPRTQTASAGSYAFPVTGFILRRLQPPQRTPR